MKTKSILFALAAVMLLPFQACSLEEDTSSLSTPENFFRNGSECQSVVNSCYIPIKSIYTYTYFLAVECVSDVIYCPSGTLDARLDISPAVPRFATTVWTNGYLGVQRCNFAIAGIQEAYKNGFITEEQMNEFLCEAKGLRGFFYWTLTSFFGNVPFYFDDVTDNAVVDRIAALGRMSAVETRDAVIKDLQEIAPKAKQTRTFDNQGNRLGAAFAYMIIAKCAMWNHEWETALEALESIEAIYGDLSGYDYAENVMFRNKNTPESIFEVQHTYTQGGLTYTSNVACVCTPTRKTDNNTGITTFDGVEIPELGSQCTTWAAARPNVFFCQGLQSKKGKDIRKDFNMAWGYDGHEFANVSSRPWMGPKFWCPNMQGTADGNNYKVFRYADAVLMMAECLNELDRDEEAVNYLNKTRVRAGLGEYTFRTHARLQDEIRSERARELFGEFQRKYDLVRWGIFYQSILDYTDYATLKDNVQPCHEYYPIPDIEVVNSKYALDNNEYTKYGL
ncbi:MAG: RagB/SusD family nutrient uptake outer membrane protein [Bacteroidales bacterium]|nr:RagB/SusD family nutrient uptake outer membrane protein [Bacteroidales bacterium]